MRGTYIALFLLFAVVLGIAFSVFQNNEYADVLIDLLKAALPGVYSRSESLMEFAREIVMSEPLRGTLSGHGGELTIAGVLAETNRQRATDKLPALAGNKVLDAVAEKKLTDMFTQQYFNHVSPQGNGPGELADMVGYDFIRVGENLALGNFDDDAALVTAWMNSPGHRENIMSDGYSEIGIAVGAGSFEGQKTWLAVQSFGLPVSACKETNEELRSLYEQKEAVYIAKNEALNIEKREIEEEAEEINQLIETVNGMINTGNAKLEEGNSLVEEGNVLASTEGSSAKAQSLWTKGKELQAAGKKLLDEAEVFQKQASTQREALLNKQKSFNAKIGQLRTLSGELSRLVEQLNKQITIFNRCAESYIGN